MHTLGGAVPSVLEWIGVAFFKRLSTLDPQVFVAGSFWILYNLERNQHFNKPY